jgi:uncharacterized protein (TIGR02246 family)
MATTPESLYDEFAAAFFARDAPVVASLFEPDALCYLAEAGVLAKGQEGIRDAYRRIFGSDQVVTGFQLQERSLVADGDHAYAHSTGMFEVHADGRTWSVPLRATEVSHRGEDGHWRFVVVHA